MRRLYRFSAGVLAVAVAAGCGVTGIDEPARAVARQQASPMNVLADPVDVPGMIRAYTAVQGFDAEAMNKRTDLLAQLRDSDDDEAMAFVQAEFDRLQDAPDAVRNQLGEALLGAIDGLDTYDEAIDGPFIAAGAGTTAEQGQQYMESMARHRRRKGVIHFLTTPFRWVGNGFKAVWNGIRGKKKRKRRRRRRTYPDPYSGGGGYGDPYSGGGYSDPYSSGYSSRY